MFECWYLAAASYNAVKERSLMQWTLQDGNFWELTKYQYLKKESERLRPSDDCPALIAKDPEKIRLVNIEYERTLQLWKVQVLKIVDLRIIARPARFQWRNWKPWILNYEVYSSWCHPTMRLRFLSGKSLFLKILESFTSSKNPMLKLRVKKTESLQRTAKFIRSMWNPSGKSTIWRGPVAFQPEESSYPHPEDSDNNWSYAKGRPRKESFSNWRICIYH